jgi:hypothetical protein
MIVEVAGQKLIEKVGSWEVDLKDYATIKYVDDELEKKVDKIDGARLMLQNEINKLMNIEENA